MMIEQDPVPGQLLALEPTWKPRPDPGPGVGLIVSVVHHENGKEQDGMGAHWTVTVIRSSNCQLQNISLYPKDLFERLAEP